MYIKDLIPGIVRKLRNRDDLAPIIPSYIKKAVFDLSQNYEFDELRYTGPQTAFVQNQAEYPRNFFSQPNHKYVTFVVSWFVYFQAPPITVGQSTGYVLKYRQPRVVEPESVILGIPTHYCQIGEQVNAGNLIVGYRPNINYATYMRYQIQHPFPDVDELTPIGQATLAQQRIYMPDDWQDIIEYCAAERACDDIGMLDVGALFHQKVYGNPYKKMPGIIVERMTQQQRQSEYNERQLRPVVKRY
jgi:hypothetical protein